MMVRSEIMKILTELSDAHVEKSRFFVSESSAACFCFKIWGFEGLVDGWSWTIIGSVTMNRTFDSVSECKSLNH